MQVFNSGLSGLNLLQCHLIPPRNLIFVVRISQTSSPLGTEAGGEDDCPAGTYNDVEGLERREDCQECPVGSYCEVFIGHNLCHMA